MSNEPLTAKVRVAVDAAPSKPVNRWLFGKFTEHLGRNVYGGAWAQILENPEFADADVWPNRKSLLSRLQTAAVERKTPKLSASLARGVPPWWVAEGEVSSRLMPKSGRWIWRVTASESSTLYTPVFLPAHRTRSYELRLRARTVVAIRVGLADAETGQLLAGVELAPDTAWNEHLVSLELPSNHDHQVGTPYHVVIELLNSGLIELSRATLFPSDHLDGWDPDVVRFMREAKLPLLRFPGGNFVSAYRWEDGVGPVDDRPVLPNPAWPEVEWNHVGTDEWLRLCELVGCEPLICVNAGDGSPEEAAAWVEYCNGDASTPMGALRAANGRREPYRVRLWEVGNEIYGEWQHGHTDAAGYAARYPVFARAMKEADPTIELIANGDTEAWNRTVVFGSDEPIRSLSHHCLYAGYSGEEDPDRVYLEHMAFTPAYARMWQELAQPMREAGVKPLIAVTEQQVFTNKRNLPNNQTLTEALWTASIINEAIRSDGLVEMITHSALINHGGGMAKVREVVYGQPVWWTTHLYGSTPESLVWIEADVESPVFSVEPYRLRTVESAPYLDAVVLHDPANGDYWLFLVNRHPTQAIVVDINLPVGSARTVEKATLTGDSFMAANDWRQPDKVSPSFESIAVQSKDGTLGTWELPACSLVRLHVH